MRALRIAVPLVVEQLQCVRRCAHRHWVSYVLVLSLGFLAYLRLFVDPTPQLPLVFNWTGSLPTKVGWIEANAFPLVRGELVIYRFEGQAALVYPALARQPFFKLVRGLPGDVVAVHGREVRINGEPVGSAKLTSFDGRPLRPIDPVVIPPQHFYAYGSDPDSFDSRYAASGLVRFDQVLGKVHAIW